MRALATIWQDEEEASRRPALVTRASRDGEGSTSVPAVTDSMGQSWNVLAEELVNYPPSHQKIWLDPPVDGAASRSARRHSSDTWVSGELERVRLQRARALSTRRESLEGSNSSYLVPPTGNAALRPSAERTRRVRQSTPSATARYPKTHRAAAGSRGLARLLPGVATLAVLAGAWFAVGSLAAGSHSGPIVRLPGSVPVSGGYAYVVRPGDTLWSIANRVEPGRDPRPLVDELESQIGGGVLRAGERIRLPR